MGESEIVDGEQKRSSSVDKKKRNFINVIGIEFNMEKCTVQANAQRKTCDNRANWIVR